MKLIFNCYSLLLLFFVWVPSQVLKGQSWEFGASLGTSGYMGDLNQDKFYKFNSLSGSAGAKYNFNPTWGIRTNLSIVGINGKGYHDTEPDMPSSFKNKVIKELVFLPEFNFFKKKLYQTKRFYTPYVFAGLGGMIYQQKTSQGYASSMKPVYPFGAGFKYDLNGNFALDSHLTYRFTGTDMLDDNGDGWDGNVFENINASDVYMTFQVGIIYTILSKNCPTW